MAIICDPLCNGLLTKWLLGHRWAAEIHDDEASEAGQCPPNLCCLKLGPDE
jgi:hypothetical protein